ncbi:MAG: hypothetical protein HYZ54_02405 [Ignavibacteriae bacterium]|nr:hypothetical protein [Ignavibacteriota bacterium]
MTIITKIVLIIIMLFLVKSEFVFAQGFIYPTIIKEGAKIKEFIPYGWKIRDSVQGDLNNDKNSDIAVILQYKDTVTIFNSEEDSPDTINIQPRILLILFLDKRTHKLKFGEQNNTFILRNDDPSLLDDPYQSMCINKGILSIDFQLAYGVGSWNITHSSYSFSYQNENFVLISAYKNLFNRATHNFENHSFDFLQKKWKTMKGNEDSDQIPETEIHLLELKEMKALKALKTPYTWEVSKDIFI